MRFSRSRCLSSASLRSRSSRRRRSSSSRSLRSFSIRRSHSARNDAISVSNSTWICFSLARISSLVSASLRRHWSHISTISRTFPSRRYIFCDRSFASRPLIFALVSSMNVWYSFSTFDRSFAASWSARYPFSASFAFSISSPFSFSARHTQPNLPTLQRVRAARHDRRIHVARRAVQRLAARAEIRYDGLVARLVAVHRVEGVQRAAAHHVLAHQLVRLQLQLHATQIRGRTFGFSGNLARSTLFTVFWNSISSTPESQTRTWARSSCGSLFRALSIAFSTISRSASVRPSERISSKRACVSTSVPPSSFSWL